MVGLPCNGYHRIHIPLIQRHVVLYTSPVIELDYGVFGIRRITLIGETNKLGLISKSRIQQIEINPPLTISPFKMDDLIMFQIELHISGSNGEEVGFTWLDTFNNIHNEDKAMSSQLTTTTCTIGENNVGIYIINFPYLRESFVTCN